MFSSLVEIGTETQFCIAVIVCADFESEDETMRKERREE